MNDKNRNLKIFLALVIFFSVFAGLLFILKSYIISSPINLPVQNQDNEEETQKDPGKSLQFPESSNKDIEFGKNITSRKQLNTHDSDLFFTANTKDFTDLINFKDDQFNLIYTTENNIEASKVYQDNTLVFVENDKRNSFLKYAVKDSNEAILFHKFDLGIVVTDFYFEPTDKSFLITYLDTNNIFTLSKLSFDKNLETIFQSSQLSKRTMIIHYDLKSQNILLEENAKCLDLNLFSKKIESTTIDKCIINSSVDYVNKAFLLDDGIYYYNETQKKLVQVVKRSIEEIIYQPFLLDNQIYFLSQNPSTLELKIKTFNTNTNAIETKGTLDTKILPESFFVNKGKYYLISLPNFYVAKIQSNVTLQDIQTPSTYLVMGLLNS